MVEALQFFTGVLLPPLTLTVFVAGMAYRFYVWATLAKPGMTLFPAPVKGAGMVGGVLTESLLLRNLLKSDKAFWAGAWIFHAMLALIIIGHTRVFSSLPDRIMGAAGMSDNAIVTMSSTLGGAAGIVILAALFFLLLRRLGITRVREISSPADFAAVLLILAVILTGNLMRFGEHFDLDQTRTYFVGLATFTRPSLPENNAFVTHFLLVQLLLIVIPFTKILHFGGIFFTHALVKRR